MYLPIVFTFYASYRRYREPMATIVFIIRTAERIGASEKEGYQWTLNHLCLRIGYFKILYFCYNCYKFKTSDVNHSRFYNSPEHFI